MAKKKTDPLVSLLEQFRMSDVSPNEMASLVRGMAKLQPEFLFGVDISSAKSTVRKSSSRTQSDIDSKTG